MICEALWRGVGLLQGRVFADGKRLGNLASQWLLQVRGSGGKVLASTVDGAEVPVACRPAGPP